MDGCYKNSEFDGAKCLRLSIGSKVIVLYVLYCGPRALTTISV